MQIDYLANWPRLIPELAALLYQEWADLYLAAGIDQAQLQQVLTERTATDTLPITLVLVKDGELVGAGSIKLTEPGTKEGLSPWLAGIYVKPQYRGLGLGRDIVQALEAKAQQLGVETLYLSADSAVDFYLSLGWQVLERLESLGVRDVALMSKRFA